MRNRSLSHSSGAGIIEKGKQVMIQRIRTFLLVEALAFIAASLVHSGVLLPGYEHAQARIAEGIIGAVLAVGWIVSLLQPDWTRAVGLAAQGFALLGTLVGLFTVAVGIGPRTVPDLIFHVVILILLAWGLAVTARSRSRAAY